MKTLKLIKPPHILVMAFSVFFIVCCNLLMNSSKQKGGNDMPLRLETTQNPESNELLKVLRRASMKDRTVVLTMIFDEAWTSPGSVLDLFLESFRLGQGTKRLLNHLVIVIFGSRAISTLRCFASPLLPTQPIWIKKGTSSFRLPFASEENKQFAAASARTRLQLHLHCKFIEFMVEINYPVHLHTLTSNFWLQEADVVWLRTPIADIHPSYEITIPCDLFSDDSHNRSNIPGRGLFYAKANAATIELFKYWKVWGILYPNTHVESLCEILKDQQEVTEMLGVRIKYLDTTYFGGFCQGGSKDIGKVYTLQANCCDNVEDKVYDLRLVLEDWKDFRAQSFNISFGIVSSLRSPTKCIA